MVDDDSIVMIIRSVVIMLTHTSHACLGGVVIYRTVVRKESKLVQRKNYAYRAVVWHALK